MDIAALLHRRRFDSVLRRDSCMWNVLLIDVVSEPCVVHPNTAVAGASSLAILLLVALLSASVLKITTLRNPPDMFCRSLPSELRLAIRRHLPCVGGISSHANGM